MVGEEHHFFRCQLDVVAGRVMVIGDEKLARDITD